ncbi:hypothetical protein PGTUg99_011435 [Puccinia graminis f. sp. tritici]|uniref:Uncharacterized protein n=1 Tax=Puccinia graminis f. sp. tritici TaxID=56615 RepID=A0A5B0S2R9_PUCGR|nr:hypothetical protein PGTUg99_011435 [Puccinia graminis f. sp. tritici]
MLFSIQTKAASALGLAMAVASAPLNERTKLNLFERGVGLGWLCHYDGIAAPSVDIDMNLPLMLGELCIKAAKASSRLAQELKATLSTPNQPHRTKTPTTATTST